MFLTCYPTSELHVKDITTYILVVGENEQNEKTVTVRFRQSSGLEQKTMKLEEFIAYVQEKDRTRFVGI